ncbi:hypothetical protein K491DRAFT_756950 [Lophiostoma macrostomum CBS 122681]|uniref:Transmembrane protein n=1 Tax=Lophiostoma macrostomum CBS 122681 TaxID=1314788 RepID=A0A6A6TCZ0_9PLEO|nr:hypothetical protein K491DRAFT_756950 [Lophiostoma macrostomum CBS 122681]
MATNPKAVPAAAFPTSIVASPQTKATSTSTRTASPQSATNTPPRSHTKSPFKLPHAAAWEVSHQSVSLLLNEPDHGRQMQLTEKWLTNMEQHLSTTIIASAIISSAICSSFSWASFGSDSVDSKCVWLAKCTWFSALIFSMGSIASACQQIGCVHRLTSHPDGLAMIRRLLGESNSAKPGVRVRSSQRILWQIPAMLLNGSLYMFVAGLCLMFYWDVGQHMRSIYVPVAAVILCFFTMSFIFTVACWGMSSIGLYYWVARVIKQPTATP